MNEPAIPPAGAPPSAGLFSPERRRSRLRQFVACYEWHVRTIDLSRQTATAESNPEQREFNLSPRNRPR